MNIKTHVPSKRRDLCLRFLLNIKAINFNHKKIQIIGGRHKCAALFKEFDFFSFEQSWSSTWLRKPCELNL